jgi:uncharacterized protein (TIGR03083 family)
MGEFDELRAFRAESEAVEGTLAAVGTEMLSRPGVGSWTLHELIAHLIGAAARLAECAPTPVEEPEPSCDRVGYWRFDLDAEAPAVAARARERAVTLDTAGLDGVFATAWRSTVGVATERGPAALVMTSRGPMRIDEYLATRVLEVCVHHLDVRTALDLPPATTPEAGRMTMAILEGLLGGPRPRNLGRNRFIQVATGRVEADDERFPLIR